jgi:cytidylate kinase
MAIVTIQGQIASGGEDMGPEIARRLGVDYIDRIIMAEAGKRVGATVEALEEKEQSVPSLGARVGHLFQRALEHSAYSGTGGDPFFGIGMDALLTTPYPEEPPELVDQPHQVDDERFFQVISEVIHDLASDGNVVILGRGANLILSDTPKALHVGVVAPLPFRINRFMRREGITQAEAERGLAEQEKARADYFERHFKVRYNDPTLYHLIVNPAHLGLQSATDLVVQAVELIEKGS